MTNDINNFISIEILKNGNIKLSQTVTHEANIYQLLHRIGYLRTKVDNRIIYAKRDGKSISPIYQYEIKDAFIKFLKNDANYSNIPARIESKDILNWFYRNKAVKENALYRQYLTSNLNEQEIHALKMQIDLDYRREYKKNAMLEMFQKWNFKMTPDLKGTINTESTIYYRKIFDNTYLLFTHYDTKVGFDSWLATYTDGSQIGVQKPTNLETIRLSFDLDRDVELIANYLK